MTPHAASPADRCVSVAGAIFPSDDDTYLCPLLPFSSECSSDRLIPSRLLPSPPNTMRCWTKAATFPIEHAHVLASRLAVRVRAWNRFGRDWKRIEGFVATKTAIQIRSHAQKHFLKARKFGLAGSLPSPPLHPRRAAPLEANAATADLMPPWLPSAVPTPPPSAGGVLPAVSSIGCMAPPSGVQQSTADWPPACYSPEDSFQPLIHGTDDCSFIETPNCSGSGEAWLANVAFLQDETILPPISPDDLGFAQVYKFIGDVFGSGEPWPVEARLRRLQSMDPAISETLTH
ncbi:hypothetical protein E2562_026996 [Oryza meyeriana var. granulata]|uniref:HTH myb-type domain-containing protein n=1 Tax=Oryza meyeriana var. granulata TaxID=110450 RepID=A0A6G1EPT3_9ORYZ|nr:hypothetical protein E2562_026996 [Oryza meyeriana var. granulata]